MKKRITLALALAAVISLSACGANKKTAETTTEAVSEQTTAAEKTETAEKTEAVTEETTVTEAVPEIAPSISKSKLFRNSSWLFEATDSNGQQQRYLYDIVNKSIIKVHEEVPDCSDISGKLIYDNFKIYNAETGETVVDDDKQHIIFPYYGINYFQFAFADDTVYVKKADDVFADAEEIGCIGNDGNWITELSSDNEFFNNSASKGTELTGLCSDFIRCANKSNNKIKSSFLYDMKNDRALGVGKFNSNLTDFAHADNSDYCYFYVVGTGLIRYDIVNDCIADTVSEGETYDDYTHVYDNNYLSYQVIDANLSKKITIIDPVTDNRVLFDLTMFSDMIEILACTDSCVLISGSIDGKYRTGVFDKNGEPLFEPILGSISNDTFRNCSSSDKIFVAYSGVNFYYNIETNTFIEGTEDYKFCGFDNKTNTLLIQAKNPDDGNIYYYLADANDPMNYYNPLEK
ncbi:MAG: hypothetical protein J5999_05280 [Oscillospiraceae bacterium]|nr:hypothetical protein [Oscillospiraceae bacterium]